MRIQDVGLWCSHSGYRTELAGAGTLAVYHGQSRVGGLVHREDGWEFIGVAGNMPKQAIEIEDNSVAESMVSQSFSLSLPNSYEASKLLKKSDSLILPESSGTGAAEHIAECNIWLPFAAKEYRLSPNIRDYVLVPIPAFFSDIPNTNGDSVTIQELLRFKPDYGMQAYKTFRGQPTFVEHDNKDYTKAKGVILDVFLRKIVGLGGDKFWKVIMLLAYDRTKDPELAERILKKEENAYSVGYYFKGYKCSICGATVMQGQKGGGCMHTRPRQPTYKLNDGRLVYRQCIDIKGFECSSVGNPAFVSAVGPQVFDTRLY